MKFFTAVLITLSLVASSYAGIEYTLRDQSEKIAAGTDFKNGENLDFCYFTVNFYTRFKTCGCLFWKDNFIITSGSCVIDAVEGVGTFFNVTFPQLSGKDALYEVSSTASIYSEYDPTMLGVKDIAVVKLTKNVKITDKKSKASTPDVTGATADFFKDKIVRTCGIGRIYNNQTFPKKYKCVDLNVVAQSETTCGAAKDTTGCVQWPDRENNACSGDYGGPLYLNTYDTKGAVATTTPIGILSYSPDARKGAAPCQDGHSFYFTQFGLDPVKAFLGSDPDAGFLKFAKN